MRFVSSLLWLAWRAKVRADRALRKALFAGFAEFGEQARLLESARIFNIGRRPGAIRIGAHSVVGGELLTFGHGGAIELGEWCYVGEGTRIWSAARISIGDRVLISHGVNIHDCDSHPRDARERHEQFRAIAGEGHPHAIESIASRPIVIGADAWIGFNATILKGVTIGARSIVAAGSVVTRDVPPDSVHIGTAVEGKSS